MKWHIEKKSLIHYSLKKGCKLMHPFLLSVFISCIYFELIFKMKSVDNTSANPRISIAGNAVPKKIAATIVAATGSTLDNNPAYTLPAYFTAARYRQNGKIVPTITIVRNPTITIISRCASILHGLKNTASTHPPISIAHAHTDSAGDRKSVV